MKALLLENIHPDAVNLLTSRGFEVEHRTGALHEDELIEALRGVDVLGVRSTTYVTERAIASAPGLKAVGAFCIGTNQINLAEATRRGIAVFNAPFSNTRSVVELVIAEIIAMARHLTDHNAAMHAGVWNKSAKGSHEIRGRTLGIIGYGNIGSQLSVVAEALGMRVIYYDVVDRLAMGNARRCDTLEQLLAEAETVTIHVDGRASNRGFFGDTEFRQMRPRSLFLNLSRGIVVDEEALARHLTSGHIAGAALDVYRDEPKTNDEPFVSPLRGIENVILTPHVGGSTQEAQQGIGQFVAGKLADFTSSGATILSVNLPQVLPGQSTGCRISHLHHNRPGVLARVNGILAELGANIDGQTLATRGDVGYVVLDLNVGASDEVLRALRALPETIRVDIL